MTERKLRPEMTTLITKRLAMAAIVEKAREFFAFYDELKKIASDGELSFDYVRSFAIEQINDAYDINIDTETEEEVTDEDV